MKVLVTGGYFDGGGDGVVWLVDLHAGRAEVLLRWTPPPHLRVPTKGFAGGSLGPDGRLYVAAHAAVVRVDLRRAAVSGVLHQPCMNDLHHVAALDGRLYVSNTGLSAADVFDSDGSFLGSHALLPGWMNARRMAGETLPAPPPLHPGWSGAPPQPWSAPPSDDGYHTTASSQIAFHQRKVPDHLHLNHVTRCGDRLLATCFADGTLRDLGRLEVVTRLEGHFLHDGLVQDDALWLSAIDGSLIELDAATFQERRRLHAFATGHHGWCRGLAATASTLAVGLTEVRRGRLPKHRWADREPEGSETSVLLLDRADGRLLARVDLTDPTRHAKLYSVLLMPDDPCPTPTAPRAPETP